jgi:hypothetical protein
LLASVLLADGFGTAGNTVTVESIKLDPAGNAYVTGSFHGTVSFGSFNLTSLGETNAFVAEINRAGNVAWAKRMGSAGQVDGDFGRGIALDAAGNVYVTGFISGKADFGPFTLTPAGSRDAFVTKLDPSGNFLWAKNFGGTGSFDLGQSLAVDAAGNMFASGTYQNSIKFGTMTLTSAGSNDIYVVSLDTSGNVVWAKSMGGTGDDEGFSIAIDGSDNVYTTGIFSGMATFGTTMLTSAGDTDIFVSKLDSLGNILWADQFGGPGHDDGVSITTDSAGNIYLTGDFVTNAKFGSINLTGLGKNDIFIARLGGSGNVVWANAFGATQQSDAGFGITTDSAGNVYDTGIFQGVMNLAPNGTAAPGTIQSNGDYDVYLLKLDPTGKLFYGQSFGSTTADQAFGVAVGGPTNRIALVGSVSGLTAIGPPANPTLPLGSSGFSETPITTVSKPPSDFDNTGRSQLALFRPATAQWFAIAPPPLGGHLVQTFGATNLYDIPIPGDYDGIGHTEVAIYRPTTAQWFAVAPTGGHLVITFGAPNLFDIPVPANYDGLGRTQPAIYRSSTGEWFVVGPNGGYKLATFGLPTDVPVPGDYDGVGYAEPAVYRPSTSEWIVLGPNGVHTIAAFGTPNLADIPAPGDYDGVGHVEVAVFRPSLSITIVQGGPIGFHVLGPFGAHSLYDLPTEAPVASLVKLGLFGGMRILSIESIGSGNKAFATVAPLPGADHSGSAIASAQTTAMRVSVPVVSIRPQPPSVRPSLVVGQGDLATMAGNDVWAVALGHLARHRRRV